MKTPTEWIKKISRLAAVRSTDEAPLAELVRQIQADAIHWVEDNQATLLTPPPKVGGVAVVGDRKFVFDKDGTWHPIVPVVVVPLSDLKNKP